MADQGKPQRQQGPNATEAIATLSRRVTEQHEEISKLKDLLNARDNWNSEIRALIGREVAVKTIDSSEPFYGVLKWVDRFNLCVVTNNLPRFFHKGSVSWIEPS